MPKVFDEWANDFSIDSKDGLMEALWSLFDIYYNGAVDDELFEWMNNGISEKIYAKCVDALVNGYEVVEQ